MGLIILTKLAGSISRSSQRIEAWNAARNSHPDIEMSYDEAAGEPGSKRALAFACRNIRPAQRVFIGVRHRSMRKSSSTGKSH